MRFTQEGFNEESFRWCFWGPTGSGGPESDAANAGAVGGGSSGGDNDNDNDGGSRGGGAPPSVSPDRSPDIGSAEGVAAAIGSMGGGNGGQRGGGAPPSVAAGRTPDIGSAQGVMSALGTIGSVGDGRPTTSPAQRGGLYSSALNASIQPTYLSGTALNNLMGGPTSVVNGVPVTRRAPVSISMPNYQPTNYGQSDLDRAMADYSSARDAAYADRQFGIDLGPFAGPFGLYEGVANALFDPTATTAEALARQGVSMIDGQAVPSRTIGGYNVSNVANYSPTGLEVVTAGGLLSDGGRVAAYDPNANIVYDTSPFSGLNPFGEGVPPNIQELYDRQRAIDDAERERNGDNDGGTRQPLIIPDEPTEDGREPMQFPQFTPREYRYTPFTSNFYTIPSRFTQPRGLI